MRIMKQFKLHLACIAFLLILAAACSKNPSKQVVGKWQNTTKSSTMEFLENGIFSGNLPFKISSGEKIDERMYGVQMDLGFKLIKYSDKNISSQVEKEDGTKMTVEGRFKPIQEQKSPWAKVLIRTDNEGNVKIIDEYQGQKFEEFKAATSDPLIFYLDLGSGELPIDKLQLTISSIDLQLNWIGQMTVNGSYKFKDDHNFEVYIPINTSEASIIFILFEGAADKDNISLLRTNLGLPIEEYQRIP